MIKEGRSNTTKVMVHEAMNCARCPICGEGFAFIPIPMRLYWHMRVFGKIVSFPGREATCGHKINVTAAVPETVWLEID